MRILTRLGAAVLALGMLYGVFRLGIASGSDTRYVVWFGIASAIAAPLGLSLLGFSFSRSDADLIQQLAKVPELERMIQQATTQEEKVKRLQEEQTHLAEIIRLEARRQVTLDRVDALEREAQRILEELTLLDGELEEQDKHADGGIASEEIKRLRLGCRRATAATYFSALEDGRYGSIATS